MTHRRYFLAGIALGTLLSLLVLVAWPFVYASHPWPGSGPSSVLRPHEYNASPLARSHVSVAFILSGAVAGWAATSARQMACAWLGLSVALLVSFVLRPAAWSSNLAPLAVLLYPLQATLFLFSGLVVRVAKGILRRSGEA